MATYHHNAVSVIGSNPQVQAFVSTAHGKIKPTGDTHGTWNHRSEEYIDQSESPFNFDSLLPLPAEYSKVPWDAHPHRGGKEIEQQTWGRQRAAYRHAKPVVCDTMATYLFGTDYTPVLSVIERVSRDVFTDLVFAVSWSSEDCFRGRCLVHRGAFIVKIEEASFFETSVHDAVAAAMEDEMLTLYMRTHDQWAGSVRQWWKVIQAESPIHQAERPYHTRPG